MTSEPTTDDEHIARSLDSLGSSGQSTDLHPDVARAVAALNAVLEEEYSGFGGLDETTMYGDLAVRVAIRFAREEAER